MSSHQLPNRSVSGKDNGGSEKPESCDDFWLWFEFPSPRFRHLLRFIGLFSKLDPDIVGLDREVELDDLCLFRLNVCGQCMRDANPSDLDLTLLYISESVFGVSLLFSVLYSLCIDGG